MDPIDLGKAFKAPFADPDWFTKALLATVWYFLMVTSPALVGAQLEYIKGVSEGDETLPGWDNFGDKWVKGLLTSVAAFILMIPIWLMTLLFILPAVAAAVSGEEVFGALAVGGMCFFYAFLFLYSIALWLYLLAAMTNYAMKGNFGAFFEFREVWERIRTNTSYWMALLYTLVIGMAFSVVLVVLEVTVIGLLLVPAAMYLQLMGIGHILGQWARHSYALAPAASAAPPAPPVPGQ